MLIITQELSLVRIIPFLCRAGFAIHTLALASTLITRAGKNNGMLSAKRDLMVISVLAQTSILM